MLGNFYKPLSYFFSSKFNENLENFEGSLGKD